MLFLWKRPNSEVLLVLSGQPRNDICCIIYIWTNFNEQWIMRQKLHGLPKDFVESESHANYLFCVKRTRLNWSQCKQCNGLLDYLITFSLKRKLDLNLVCSVSLVAKDNLDWSLKTIVLITIFIWLYCLFCALMNAILMKTLKTYLI